jgi:peptidoglycan/xylan/chitin deacetylase (PgdA/CDA1 family)
MLLKTALSLATPAGPSARLTVAIFHRVLPAPDPRRPSLPDMSRFDEQMRWLGRSFQVLPLADAVRRLQLGTLPARAAAISFDDGYADNVTCALPVLRRHGLHATFFIATGYLDGGVMWNDVLSHSVHECGLSSLDASAAGLGTVQLPDPGPARTATVMQINAAVKHLDFDERERVVEAIRQAAGVDRPRALMMSTQQLRNLHAAGMGIGGHTVKHPILARCSDELAWREITEGARQLREVLRSPVDLFAYPNGRPGADYGATHVRMVREAGFSAAFSTSAGAARQGDDAYQLPRFMPWDKDHTRFALRMLRNLWTTHQGVPPGPPQALAA